MKYPWASVAIIAVWGGSLLISVFRANSDPAMVLVFATLATAIIAILGFRS
ncbi:hypothetical protein HYV91_01700 [Candidatus Wolfebacteria bacterium]|nr:hypothetical protein [Candidatus Wolfebacteria bacterium]